MMHRYKYLELLNTSCDRGVSCSELMGAPGMTDSIPYAKSPSREKIGARGGNYFTAFLRLITWQSVSNKVTTPSSNSPLDTTS